MVDIIIIFSLLVIMLLLNILVLIKCVPFCSKWKCFKMGGKIILATNDLFKVMLSLHIPGLFSQSDVHVQTEEIESMVLDSGKTCCLSTQYL